MESVMYFFRKNAAFDFHHGVIISTTTKSSNTRQYLKLGAHRTYATNSTPTIHGIKEVRKTKHTFLCDAMYPLETKRERPAIYMMRNGYRLERKALE